MTDAIRLIAALTSQPDAIDALLGKRDFAERDRVAATLIKLAAAARQPDRGDAAYPGDLQRPGRDKQA